VTLVRGVAAYRLDQVGNEVVPEPELDVHVRETLVAVVSHPHERIEGHESVDSQQAGERDDDQGGNQYRLRPTDFVLPIRVPTERRRRAPPHA
jgi:hypothetical protein